jgi:hypothetical protein
MKDLVRDGRRPRNGLLGAVAIAIIALLVIVVPHFISSSPVSNDDTDPANAVPTTAVPSGDDDSRQRE